MIELLEDFAPKALKEDYDNVGLMIGERKSVINSVLVSLDCTMEVILEAVDKGCQLIISHHPLLFRKPSSITEDTLIGAKIRKVIQNNLNLYAMHTNLDVAEGGLNDIIVNVLGFGNGSIIERSSNGREDKKDGIGRLIELKDEMTLAELSSRVKSSLNLGYLRYIGERERKVKKLAVINGSGQDYFDKAKNLGADCIISGDTTYHYVSDLYEEGIAVIDAGHFGTEWPAMKNFALVFEKLLKERGLELNILVSEKNFDPYKIY
ncbi:MAG: Nif3-like dinuclear metal center hexameric protein [Bacillota bacterium]|nr:Nif3-like dinuclear metal center hexameric protein [Bacillota bacterium]